MARADLTAMLGRLEDAPASSPQPTAEATKRQTAATRKPKATEDARTDLVEPAAPRPLTAPVVASTPSVTAGGPLFSRLDRKEIRLRPDQYAALTTHARRLSQAKQPGGERITENTLIRIAIDLLLEHADQLTGQTEQEIKKSVTL